jgi:uncharacterized protein
MVMARVVHFEIHAEDPERAVRFYTTVFGWEFTKWDGPADYWLVKTGPDSQPGINGGLLRRHGPGSVAGQAVNAYACTAQVDSVDATAQAIASNGGAIVVPKMTIQGVGWLVYATDTEGNIFGVMQRDPTAK